MGRELAKFFTPPSIILYFLTLASLFTALNTSYYILEDFNIQTDFFFKKKDGESGRIRIFNNKMPKAYPAYTGSYEDFGVIRNFTDWFENLFCTKFTICIKTCLAVK